MTMSQFLYTKHYTGYFLDAGLYHYIKRQIAGHIAIQQFSGPVDSVKNCHSAIKEI
jgi:hypothetical protein